MGGGVKIEGGVILSVFTVCLIRVLGQCTALAGSNVQTEKILSRLRI
jgi:hypothetical protein